MTDDLSARPPLDVSRLTASDVARIEVLDRADSTNALVAERARGGEPGWLVIVTEHQTRGRGRLDRSWETPARAALTFSVLVRPSAPAAQWPWLSLLTGQALGRALREGGIAADLKWPNDVLIGERKVAGILVERIETPAGPAAVVGIGLNVSTRAEELPVPSATSLLLETGQHPDRTDLLLGILRVLREEYDAWQTGDAEELRSAYQRACVTVGRAVRVDLPGGEMLSGTAVGVDAGGRLRVRSEGREVVVGAGDVVHVRAVGDR